MVPQKFSLLVLVLVAVSIWSKKQQKQEMEHVVWFSITKWESWNKKLYHLFKRQVTLVILTAVSLSEYPTNLTLFLTLVKIESLNNCTGTKLLGALQLWKLKISKPWSVHLHVLWIQGQKKNHINNSHNTCLNCCLRAMILCFSNWQQSKLSTCILKRLANNSLLRFQLTTKFFASTRLLLE